MEPGKNQRKKENESLQG